MVRMISQLNLSNYERNIHYLFHYSIAPPGIATFTSLWVGKSGKTYMYQDDKTEPVHVCVETGEPSVGEWL